MAEEERNSTFAFVGRDINSVARVVFIVLSVAEVVVGVFGNCILLAGMLRRRSLYLRNVHNLLVANLALADLMILTSWKTFFVLDLILGYHPVVNNAHCQANGFLVMTCSMVSVLSLTSISFNRYLHVCHHQLFKKFITTARTIACCVLCWVVSFLMASLPLMGVGKYSYNRNSHICSFDKHDTRFYSILVIVLVLCVIPLCLVGYWNFAIFRFWKYAHMTFHRTYSITQSDVDKKRKTSIWSCASLTDRSRHNNGQSSSDAKNECPSVSLVEKRPENDVKGDDTKCDADVISVPSVEGKESVLQDVLQTRELNPLESASQEQHGTAFRTPSVHSRQGAPAIKHNARRRKQVSTYVEELQSRAHERQVAERAFVASLCVIFAIMFASYIPFFFINAIHTSMSLRPEVTIVGNLLLFLNSSVNWIVYGVMNQSFRTQYVQHLRQLCRWCLETRSRQPVDDTDTSLKTISQVST